MKIDDIENKKSHSQKSCGMIGLAKTSGGNPYLFGSNIKNHSKMQLTIKQGEKERTFNRESYFGMGAPIIVVEMSPNQFSNMLMSPNCGDGVPCTITYTKEEGGLKYSPDSNLIKTIVKENNDSLQLFRIRLKQANLELANLVNTKKVSKLATEDLSLNLKKMLQDLDGNLDCVAEMQQKEINNMLEEAKSQIESFMDNKIHSTGVATLQKELLSFESSETNKEKLLP